MIENKFSEVLEVILTEKEIREKSEENNKRVLELAELKAAKKRSDEAYTSRIKLVTQESEDIARVLEAGKERRPVDCEWLPDFDTREMVARRLDTYQALRRRPMNADERREYFQQKLWKVDSEAPPPVALDADQEAEQEAEQEATATELELQADGTWKEREEPEEMIFDDKDEFTAPRCEECKRTDGGHTPDCSQSESLTYDDYFAYAQSQGRKNPASFARKMEVTSDPKFDEAVRDWKKSSAPQVQEAMAGGQA